MTDAKIRLGFVNGDHLHFNGLVQAAFESPTAEVIGAVIDDEELRNYFADKYPQLRMFESSDELYEIGDPNAIVTCADNFNAAAIVAEAAERGVHVMKEKPMAASLAVAEEMATTAARHDIRLMINWPNNWSPAIQHLKTLTDAGEIGNVWQIHHRAGHGGPPRNYQSGSPVGRVGWDWLIDRERNGGGAAVDFCSYGAVLSRWIMGQPSRVLGLGGRYSKDFFTVEDNAVMILGYPKGHSICEGTWTQPAMPVHIPGMVYGDQGAIAILNQTELKIANQGRPGEHMNLPREGTVIEAPALPAHYKSPVDYFTYSLLHDEPFTGIVAPEISRDAQEILEAGLASMESGQEIGLPLPSFLN
ncbi:MAG TPA: Gfo/Idh/MocA family oxidoreductase [Thermomicrobiales bacterium]|nr:Gfo/Idh/MocA family oxidoreductase [Thermomicrobiales bacterium]